MKKVLLTAATLCLLISCKDSTSSGDADRNNKNLDFNRQILKGIEKGDSTAINAHIADDAVDHQGPNGQDVKGGDNVRHMLADMHNHVKDLKFDVLAEASNGDYIFCLTHMTGTTSDATWGMPSGTAIDEKGVDVVKVNKDNKMTEHWGFVDPVAMMKHANDMGTNKMDNKMDNKMATDSAKK